MDESGLLSLQQLLPGTSPNAIPPRPSRPGPPSAAGTRPPFSPPPPPVFFSSRYPHFTEGRKEWETLFRFATKASNKGKKKKKRPLRRRRKTMGRDDCIPRENYSEGTEYYFSLLPPTLPTAKTSTMIRTRLLRTVKGFPFRPSTPYCACIFGGRKECAQELVAWRYTLLDSVLCSLPLLRRAKAAARIVRNMPQCRNLVHPLSSFPSF